MSDYCIHRSSAILTFTCLDIQETVEPSANEKARNRAEADRTCCCRRKLYFCCQRAVQESQELRRWSAVLPPWVFTLGIWLRWGMWSPTVFPHLNRRLLPTTFPRESPICGGDLGHLYSKLHHPWLWRTWPTHGAIMFMKSAKRRIPLTSRMTIKVAPLKTSLM